MMTLAYARLVTEDLVDRMRPYCERVEIAGSIRREKPEGIKDIEIVAIPRWERDESACLFAEEAPQINRLHRDWVQLATVCGVEWIKTGTNEIIPWDPKPDGKYWRGLIRKERVKLDLFLTTPEQWGLIFLIRTGSADFSKAVVTHALRVGMRADGGHLIGRAGQQVATPEERDVFEALDLDFVPPSQRVGAGVLRSRRSQHARAA